MIKVFWNILKQIFISGLQSCALLKRGKFKAAYYWFLVRNKVSLFGGNMGALQNINLCKELYKDGFQEIEPIDNELKDKLIQYFLENISENEKFDNLETYLDKSRSSGFTRSSTVGIENEKDILNQLFEQTNLDKIACSYLGLNKDQVVFSAKIDSLVRLETERKLKNGYDDALEYHRDIDSFNFVKAFIYLNDIDIGSGQHEMFLGSHKKMPLHFRTVTRFLKDDIQNKLPDLELKEVVGPSGYSWIEDTTSLHRGTVPTNGDRLMLSFSFNDKKSAAPIYNSYEGSNAYYPL